MEHGLDFLARAAHRGRQAGIATIPTGNGLEHRPGLDLVADKAFVQAAVRIVVRLIQCGNARREAFLLGMKRVVIPDLRAWKLEAQIHQALDIAVLVAEIVQAALAHRIGQIRLPHIDNEIFQSGTDAASIPVGYECPGLLRGGVLKSFKAITAGNAVIKNRPPTVPEPAGGRRILRVLGDLRWRLTGTIASRS